MLFLVPRDVQSVGRPAFRHFVSVACGPEASESSRDVATQTRREFVVESPSRESEDIEAVSEDEQREADAMILDDEDIAESSGNVAAVGEAGTSIVSSSVQPGPVVVRRSVRAGKLNNFIDHVTCKLCAFSEYVVDVCSFIFKCVLRSFLYTVFSVVLIFHSVEVFF